MIEGAALGKPADDRDAKRMLRRLSGRTHEVLTGVSIASSGRFQTRVETTRVTMSEMAEEEIDWYVATGEPRDKAGAYAVQGRAAAFITGIRGSYPGIMGLPLYETAQLLRALQTAGSILYRHRDNRAMRF